MRKEATVSIASGVSKANPPPESNHPNSGRSEDSEQELRGEGQGKGGDGDDEEDWDEDQDEEGGLLLQGSDLWHWTFSRTIRQLGPRNGDAQGVLRHGRPCYEEGGGDSELNTNATLANEGAELPGPDDPVYEYSYNEWFHYIGDPMEEGEQSNIDKLTRYRIRGDQEWLPIPEGFRAPRYSSYQEQEVEQHLLACSKLGARASNFEDPRIPTAAPSSPAVRPENASAKVARTVTLPPSQPRRPLGPSQHPAPDVLSAPPQQRP